LLATDNWGADQTLLPPFSGRLLSNTWRLFDIRYRTTAYALFYFTQAHIRVLSNAKVLRFCLCCYVRAAALFMQLFLAGLIVRLGCLCCSPDAFHCVVSLPTRPRESITVYTMSALQTSRLTVCPLMHFNKRGPDTCSKFVICSLILHFQSMLTRLKV
jgi:hypothetical protein